MGSIASCDECRDGPWGTAGSGGPARPGAGRAGHREASGDVRRVISHIGLRPAAPASLSSGAFPGSVPATDETVPTPCLSEQIRAVTDVPFCAASTRPNTPSCRPAGPPREPSLNLDLWSLTRCSSATNVTACGTADRLGAWRFLSSAPPAGPARYRGRGALAAFRGAGRCRMPGLAGSRARGVPGAPACVTHVNSLSAPGRGPPPKRGTRRLRAVHLSEAPRCSLLRS